MCGCGRVEATICRLKRGELLSEDLPLPAKDLLRGVGERCLIWSRALPGDSNRAMSLDGMGLAEDHYSFPEIELTILIFHYNIDLHSASCYSTVTMGQDRKTATTLLETASEFPGPYVRHSYPVSGNEQLQLLPPTFFFTEIGRDLRKLKVFNKFRISVPEQEIIMDKRLSWDNTKHVDQTLRHEANIATHGRDDQGSCHSRASTRLHRRSVRWQGRKVGSYQQPQAHLGGRGGLKLKGFGHIGGSPKEMQNVKMAFLLDKNTLLRRGER
ncbi:hypothetical protein RJ640_018220 [Escallonia rubra]|uniref:Uncharacterized protein n=1 Tax=Escallonia rubra TaxID=112253 RepID=A0AA88UEE8_9ASTE|nr:hypothetical protein RJ640_018220 [Escallonia rubra]